MMKGYFLASAFLAISGVSWAAPVVPGLHGKHPLDEVQKGHLLAKELRCAACHDGFGEEGMKAAPDLKSVGTRVNRSYLEKFIANPAGTHPGTTMPDVLSGLPPEEKKRVSESISHYLSSLRGPADELQKLKELVKGDALQGKKVYHEVGCVTCHSPHDDAGKELRKEGVISLTHLSGKHQPGALAELLMNPLKVRPSGRMPDMDLSTKEAADLAAYLEVGTVEGHAAIPKDRVSEGRKNFLKFNCNSCHEVEGPGAKTGPALADMDFANGCLSERPKGAADYHLDAGQVKALRAAHEKPVEFTSADHLKMKLTQMNCIACHERDDYGGVSEDLDAYFGSTEEALGNEARIPPPLTLMGAKLKPGWLAKVLYDRERVRPYMTTRMPHYGVDGLKGLTELFDELDQIEEVEFAEPTRETRPMVNNGGHLLLGDKGLNCIACHNYNGKESPGMKGLDLTTSFQRLQPGWFAAFMKNPGAHRKGIIMPNFWPDGKAVQPDILGGDTHAQLEALWYQFSLGRSARDPAGLRTEPSKLIVTDKVKVYRGRSRVAGYRGIAVGFPGGMNYAFNAQNGALTAIWKGEFVTANWRSQGAGDFNPASKSVALEQDVGFLQLKSSDDLWTLYQVTTKENPVNPDPLYPKNQGYAFKGYFFDTNGNPTLMYRCGEVVIEEKSEVAEGKILRRTFHFDSPAQTTVFFRALTGKIESAAGNIFTNADLKISVGDAKTKLRDFGDEGEKELLIELSLPAGKTNFTIDYELLR
ncbi:c-type cytochrome [bacterium]|nr:c-type cytochrome [bacterium]